MPGGATANNSMGETVHVNAGARRPYGASTTSTQHYRNHLSAPSGAVASSTAIETGKSVRSIEGRLKAAARGKFRKLKLGP